MLGERKGTILLENSSPGKRFPTILTTSQTAFQDETKAQTMMGQWWLDQTLARSLKCLYPWPSV